MDYVKENSKIWDDRSANADRWSVPVSSEETALARKGEWSIVLTPSKPVPRDWFPQELAGKNVLCLAGGGGHRMGRAAGDARLVHHANGGRQPPVPLHVEVFIEAADGGHRLFRPPYHE